MVGEDAGGAPQLLGKHRARHHVRPGGAAEGQEQVRPIALGIADVAVAPDLPCEVEVDTLEQLDEVLKAHNVPDVEINKMTYENAMRWYHWDPFTHIPKDQATVGALRKAAEGHDVSIRALSHHEKGTRGDALHAAARGNSGD